MPNTSKENPVQFLSACKNRQVRVSLKWDITYVGTFVEYDRYFNVEMRDVKEYSEDRLVGELARMVIRCNNVRMIERIEETERNDQTGQLEQADNDQQDTHDKHSDQTAQPKQADQTEQPEQANSDQADQTDQSDRHDQLGRHDQ